MAGDEELQIIKSSVQAFLADYDTAERAVTIPTISLEMPLSSIELPILPRSLRKSETLQKATWQQRRTEEVLHLQLLAVQLSKKLRKLKRAMKPSARVSQVKVGGALLWKGIAKRQFQLRRSCEMENTKIRRALRSHFRRAQSYQHALKLRFSPRPTESCRNEELHD